MGILYFLGVRAYGFAIRLSAYYNPKAREWILGRKGWQSRLKESFAGKNEKRIWFHCASLGEFEQGKPLLESIKKEYSNHKIVLTFFSPSGYNVKKNDPVADYVFYMPLDDPFRSSKFIELVNPSMVFFVKYEFWYYYGKILLQRKIPFFCVSAIFRPGQIFFYSIGNFFKKILLRFTHIFVQDQESLELLYRNHVTNVTVAGDTRFDRVYANSIQKTQLPEIEKFCEGSKVMICGSTWPMDEEVLMPLINEGNPGLKFIIVPHEINASGLEKIKNNCSRRTQLYSDWKNDTSGECDVLIIDNVGMLSNLYRYGNYAFIGGGFGNGIHNILEAVVYGIPVFFGPNYQNFREARDLVKLKCAFSVSNTTELKRDLNSIISDDLMLKKIDENLKHYIQERKGATEVVMSYLRMNYLK